MYSNSLGTNKLEKYSSKQTELVSFLKSLQLAKAFSLIPRTESGIL